nr:hypothetical protein [Tanacetum cinerariifolium]
MSLRRRGVKTEILRILAGQVTTLAAMAVISFFLSLACLSLLYNVSDTPYNLVCRFVIDHGDQKQPKASVYRVATYQKAQEV